MKHGMLGRASRAARCGHEGCYCPSMSINIYSGPIAYKMDSTICRQRSPLLNTSYPSRMGWLSSSGSATVSLWDQVGGQAVIDLMTVVYRPILSRFSKKFRNGRQNLGIQRFSNVGAAISGWSLSNEVPMYKLIGWLAVSCFAIYGFARFVQSHVVAEKPSGA